MICVLRKESFTLLKTPTFTFLRKSGCKSTIYFFNNQIFLKKKLKNRTFFKYNKKTHFDFRLKKDISIK